MEERALDISWSPSGGQIGFIGIGELTGVTGGLSQFNVETASGGRQDYELEASYTYWQQGGATDGMITQSMVPIDGKYYFELNGFIEVEQGDTWPSVALDGTSIS